MEQDVAEDAVPRDIRDDIADVLMAIWPLYETGKFGSNSSQAAYGCLVDELGLARTMNRDEWRQTVITALPAPEPVLEAVEHGKRDILQKARKYACDHRVKAMLTAIDLVEDPVKAAYQRGRHDAFDTMRLYLDGAMGDEV